ncbi:MAG: TolC family protein [Sphingomonadales bacterium]|nr:TolC family protein [Sphingomonadales bacterium]
MRRRWRAALVPLALVIACGGCVGVNRSGPAPLHLSPDISAPQAPWWDAAHDPLLGALIEQGLQHDADLQCRAEALAQRAQAVQNHRIKARLARLVGPHDTPEDLGADSYVMVRAREALAIRIALAYIDARRWQERITLREAALAPLRDNGEIARYRREAGLVPALDGDMADVITGLDESSVATARGHLGDAIATLARLTGLTAEELNDRLKSAPRLPDLDIKADDAPRDLSHRADVKALQLRIAARLAQMKWTQDRLDHQLADTNLPATPEIAQWRAASTRAQAEITQAAAALATAQSRLAPIAQSMALALRVQSDARLAYRAGTESFATLYVAEGAALAAQERQIDARAALAGTTVALWHAQGLGWDATALTPTPSGAVCDQP